MRNKRQKNTGRNLLVNQSINQSIDRSITWYAKASQSINQAVHSSLTLLVNIMMSFQWPNITALREKNTNSYIRWPWKYHRKKFATYRCSGVMPWSSFMPNTSSTALSSHNSLTMSTTPREQAKCSGVVRSRVWALMDAPFSSKTATASRLPP